MSASAETGGKEHTACIKDPELKRDLLLRASEPFYQEFPATRPAAGPGNDSRQRGREDIKSEEAGDGLTSRARKGGR